MKLNTDVALEMALKRLNKMMDDPIYLDEMRKAEAERRAWRMKSYQQKLDYWKNNPDYVVHETDRGFKAYPKNSEKGKELVLNRRREKIESERRQYTSENPLEAALDDIIADGDTTTKIEIRKSLTQYTGFDIDKFNALIKMVLDEGIKII